MLLGLTSGIRPSQCHHEFVALNPEVGSVAGLIAQQPNHARDAAACVGHQTALEERAISLRQ